MTRRLVLAVAAGLALWLAVSLGTETVALRRYAGLEVISPGHLEQVRLPVTIRWQAADEQLARHVRAGNAYLAVFVDRPPLAPGENLSTLLTQECVRDPGCPTREWFAERHVHLTRAGGVELEVIPQRLGAGGHELHQATIVVLDDTGTRLGESQWITRFLLDRHAEPEAP